VRYSRDKRKKIEVGVLRDQGGEEIPFRTAAAFWDADRSAGARVTLIVETDTDEDLAVIGDGSWDIRIGSLPSQFGAARDAIAHGKVHAIFPTATPKRWQVEATLTDVSGPEPELTQESIAPKQVIVMRRDLNMRKGKMVAQGSHASMKVILEQMVQGPEEGKRVLWASGAMRDWLDHLFTKVCVQVGSEAELLAVYEAARTAGLPCALITDAGLTEFNGVPTITCCAIGPEYPDKIDPITGHLKLL
jgi:PTH2 family peptidyl-tRNA hydrolase